MYGDLAYAVPGVTQDDIGQYFKDASFGVRPDDVARTYSPRGDVTIVRDRSFMDADQWAIAPYDEADLTRQYDRFDDLYGDEGRVIQRDVSTGSTAPPTSRRSRSSATGRGERRSM